MPIQKHVTRSGVNLLTNPTFAGGAQGWTLSGSPPPTYDGAVGRTTLGSIQYPYLLNNWNNLISGFVAVAPATQYTYACYMKVDALDTAPGHLTVYAVTYDSGFQIIDGWQQMGFMNSAPGIWEECAHVFITPDTCVYVQVAAGRLKASEDWHHGTEGEISSTFSLITGAGDATIWVDDMYLGTGYGFEQAPAQKVAFTGTKVTIDDLGNWQRHNGVSFEDFYPVAIHFDNILHNAGTFKAQGFNSVMAGVISSAQIGEYAGYGMYSFFNLAHYLVSFFSRYEFAVGGYPPGWEGTKLYLRDTMDEIVTDGNDAWLVGMYHDNENDWTQWDDIQVIADIVRAWGLFHFGGDHSPIYHLQGLNGTNRGFRNTGWPKNCLDTIGTYANASFEQTAGAGGNASGHFAMNNHQNQICPVTFIQINSSNNVRLPWYQGIIEGGKGMAYYADGFTYEGGEDVTVRPWWSTFPQLVTEITVTMKELIQQPHWTDWTVTTDRTATEISFGTRDLAANGYILMVNLKTFSINVTFTISGLAYSPSEVKNFFDDTTVATVTANQFTLSLPGISQTAGTMVVYFAHPVVTSGDTTAVIANESALTIVESTIDSIINVNIGYNDIYKRRRLQKIYWYHDANLDRSGTPMPVVTIAISSDNEVTTEREYFNVPNVQGWNSYEVWFDAVSSDYRLRIFDPTRPAIYTLSYGTFRVSDTAGVAGVL